MGVIHLSVFPSINVVRLRKALERNPATPQYIQTVRGHGYVFVPAASDKVAV